MARGKYPKQVIEHFTQPKNFGRMTDPDGAAMVKGQCGDTMEMYLKIKDEKISEILFFTDGCGVTVACGSITTELVKGQSINDALRISPADVVDKLHNFLGSNFHCAILAVTTLHKALADYLLKKGL
jgi:nitrogen fixation NifU-like protein